MIKGQILLLLLLSFFPKILWAQEAYSLKFCYGEVMGRQWDIENSLFIEDVFSDAGIPVNLVYLPVARAEKMFETGQCNIHTGSEYMPWSSQIGSTMVAEPVYRVELVVYANSGYRAKSPRQNQFIDIDQDRYNIGSIRSEHMEKLFRNFNSATIVNLNDIAQGISMLKKDRLNFLVVPEIKSVFTDDHVIEKTQLEKVQSILSLDLHWWLTKEHSQHANKLSSSIKRIKLKYQ